MSDERLREFEGRLGSDGGGETEGCSAVVAPDDRLRRRTSVIGQTCEDSE